MQAGRQDQTRRFKSACAHLLPVAVPLLSPRTAGRVLPAVLRSGMRATRLLRLGVLLLLLLLLLLTRCDCGVWLRVCRLSGWWQRHHHIQFRAFFAGCWTVIEVPP